MKTRPIKLLLLAATLPLLAGCSLLDNILGGIALNLVFDSELVLNRVSMASGEAEVGSFSELPVSAEKRADLTYGLDALIVPKHVAVSQMGFTIEIDFELIYSEGAQNLFYVETMSGEEEMESEDLEASVQILYPVGSQTKPTSVEGIGDWLDVDRLINLKNETAKDVSVTVKGKSGNKTKSKTFYFNLNSEGIALPSGDVDIDVDHALVVSEPGSEASVSFTIPKANLAAGHAIPLQVMWIDLGDLSAASGTVTITIDGLGTAYEALTPAVGYGPLDITKNETLIEWTNTIKLKAGQPAPAADLVVTYKALVTLGA